MNSVDNSFQERLSLTSIKMVADADNDGKSLTVIVKYKKGIDKFTFVDKTSIEIYCKILKNVIDCYHKSLYGKDYRRIPVKTIRSISGMASELFIDNRVKLRSMGVCGFTESFSTKNSKDLLSIIIPTTFYVKKILYSPHFRNGLDSVDIEKVTFMRDSPYSSEEKEDDIIAAVSGNRECRRAIDFVKCLYSRKR